MGKVMEIWNHPDIAPHVRDDFSDFLPLPHIVSDPHIICLMPEAEDAYFIFVPWRVMMFEVHGAVCPESRHRSMEYGRAAIAWMRQNTACKTILSFVPKGNFSALAFDRALGFKRVGVVEKSNPAGRQLRDMTLMALEV